MYFNLYSCIFKLIITNIKKILLDNCFLYIKESYLRIKSDSYWLLLAFLKKAKNKKKTAKKLFLLH